MLIKGALNSPGKNIKGGICMNLRPLGDRVIVKVLEEEEKTSSGIVLPD